MRRKTKQGKLTCLTKVRYKNRKLADRAAEYFIKVFHEDNRVYKCMYGKHFHLTTTPPKQRK